MNSFPAVSPHPNFTVSTPIAKWWPEPVTLPGDKPRLKDKLPTGTTWHHRKHPDRPVTDPWSGPLDGFLDYLTGTSDAPDASLLADSPVEVDWEDDLHAILALLPQDWEEDDDLYAHISEPGGWSVADGEREHCTAEHFNLNVEYRDRSAT